MSDLVPYRDRKVTKHLGALGGVLDIKRAELHVGQELAQAKIQMISEVTDFAMTSVAMLKRKQNMLEQMVPDAAEILNLIANTGGMSTVRIVNELGNS